MKKIFYHKSSFPKFFVPIILIIAMLAFLFFAVFGFFALLFFGALAAVTAIVRLLNPFRKKRINKYDPASKTYTLEESDYEIIDEGS